MFTALFLLGFAPAIFYLVWSLFVELLAFRLQVNLKGWAGGAIIFTSPLAGLLDFIFVLLICESIYPEMGRLWLDSSNTAMMQAGILLAPLLAALTTYIRGQLISSVDVFKPLFIS